MCDEVEGDVDCEVDEYSCLEGDVWVLVGGGGACGCCGN